MAIATFDFAKDTGNGNNLTSAISVYTPFNRRFELRWDIPVVISNRGPFPGKDYHVSTPDFQLTPRFALSETEDSAQSLDVTFRMPTGDVFNGQGEAAVSPFYNFWVNPWAGLVVRGGVGFGLPFGYQSVDALGARSRFLSNLAFGYYFTPHDWAPMGDTVWYLSTNFDRPIDDRGPTNNNVSITPWPSHPSGMELVRARRRGASPHAAPTVRLPGPERPDEGLVRRDRCSSQGRKCPRSVTRSRSPTGRTTGDPRRPGAAHQTMAGFDAGGLTLLHVAVAWPDRSLARQFTPFPPFPRVRS